MKESKKIKLLLVAGIFPPEIGGPATYAAEMVRELPARGFEVEVLTFRSVKKWSKVLRHLIFFVNIVLKSFSKDVVFVQDTLSSGFPAVLASILTRKPTVLRAPGDNVWEQSVQRFGVKENIDIFQNKRYGFKIEFLRFLQKFAVRYATEVYTPSRYFSRLVASWVGSSKKICTIYNGIDIDFKPDGQKYEKLTLVTAGRLVSWKGIVGLIELLSKMPDFQLKIAGSGPEKEYLEERAKEIGVYERVDFLGTVDRERLMGIVSKSHVFVLNTYFESFSFQVVEALATGTPVITTKVGSLPEIITNEENGVLVTPDDLISIEKYVRKIIEEDIFRQKLSKNGIERSKDFSVKNTMDQLDKLLKSVIRK